MTKINWKNEVLAGITTALALTPEAIAFALLAGLSPLTGLYAAFIIGLVTSIIGGRPGMISGAAGALAIVIVDLVKSHGPEYIFAAVVLAGIFQLVFGQLKLGKFIRLVPQSVMFGFVNGLASVIFISQLAQFKGLGQYSLYMMLALVALSMIIIWLFPKVTKSVPSPLIAILTVTFLVIGLNIDTKTVGDITSIKGGLPSFHVPRVPFNLETLKIILPYSLIIACVGLIESLLTLNLVDELTETKGDGNTESVAQGIGNIITGLFSGMGGCAMIGQSIINISSGGRTRVSGIIASLTLLMFILFGSSIIEQIPTAALTGVMIMAVFSIFEWSSIKMIGRMPTSDVLIGMLVALITIIWHNLALAVFIGVILSALVFAWQSAKQIKVSSTVDKNRKTYKVKGPLFFGSIASFNESFTITEDPDLVYIDFNESRVTDLSAIEAINKLTKKYKEAGKELHLVHLSKDCCELINKADSVVDINVIEDPEYKIVV